MSFSHSRSRGRAKSTVQYQFAKIYAMNYMMIYLYMKFNEVNVKYTSLTAGGEQRVQKYQFAKRHDQVATQPVQIVCMAWQ